MQPDSNEQMEFSAIIFHKDPKRTEASILAVQDCFGSRTYEIFVLGASREEMDPSFRPEHTKFLVSQNRNALCHAACQLSNGRYILFLSTDALLSGRAFGVLEDALEQNAKIGAVGPVSNFSLYAGEQLVPPPILQSDPKEAEQLVNQLAEQQLPLKPVLFLQNACILVRREALQAAGAPDASMGVFWGADFSLRMLQAGYRAVVCPNAYVPLLAPQQDAQAVRDGGMAAQRKWGFPLYYSGLVRHELLRMADIGRPGIHVLDLGCACGGNLMHIRHANPSAKLYGVELNQHAAEIARLFGEVVAENLETWDNEAWNGRFDVIILGDIVEHLVHTEAFLGKVFRWLKPGGKAVASIPNVMHISVLSKLLLHGRWQYEEAGILDRTHLRFFTKTEMLSLMQKIGFVVKRLGCNRSSMSEEEEKLKSFLLQVSGKGEATEEFDAVQYFLLTEKPYQNTVEDKLAYVEYIERMVQRKSESFVPFLPEGIQRRDTDTKVIAWYLPQFHRLEVNDMVHGGGFTEWTNSSRGIPLFTGHYQPHIPYDVGYYDLMNPDTFKRQIYLAKHYGIYGFCFHWYWFSGTQVMERPIKLLLEHPELDIPFCLSWATEPWIDHWDGGKNEIIYEMHLPDRDDCKAFFSDILPALRDERYIKLQGCPVFGFYRCGIFEREPFRDFLSNLRELAKQNGFPNLYIFLTTSYGFDENVEEWGADALVEYSAHWPAGSVSYRPAGYVNPYYKGAFIDVTQPLKDKVYMAGHKSPVFYRSACTSWDNTARNTDERGSVTTGYTPETFKTWLKDIMLESKQIHRADNDIVFANSWNEWAEGSHMEPDMHYGYAWLQAVYDAIMETRGGGAAGDASS